MYYAISPAYAYTKIRIGTAIVENNLNTTQTVKTKVANDSGPLTGYIFRVYLLCHSL